MVAFTNIIIALGVASTAQACVRTCSATQVTSTHCNYACTQACTSISPTTARNNFLDALLQHGYSCSATGATGVSCKKGGSFGTNCYDHYWTCGSNC